MFFKRKISETIKSYARGFPVVAVLGPRQSGKTSLVRELFPSCEYVTLEDADQRFSAQQDPRAFLLALVEGGRCAVIDEIQNVPVLFSYMQGIVDVLNKPGIFIITGSHNFLLNQAITQSLAGRVGIVTLLPFSVTELKDSSTRGELQLSSSPMALDTLMYKGFYPRLYSQPLTPEQLYSSYIQTYLERDVRLLINVGDLHLFQTFLKLCAGSVGQLLNMSSFANDCGVSVPTVRAWLSVLEASYIIFLLYPYHKNFNKRMIKSPKLYFYDTGLACSLLRIHSPETLHNHYARGALFESFVFSEFMKKYYNEGKRPALYFWRDSQGHEVDCIIEKGDSLIALEMKSGMTFSGDFVKPLYFWKELTKTDDDCYVVYAGPHNYHHKGVKIINWTELDTIAIL